MCKMLIDKEVHKVKVKRVEGSDTEYPKKEQYQNCGEYIRKAQATTDKFRRAQEIFRGQP